MQASLVRRSAIVAAMLCWCEPAVAQNVELRSQGGMQTPPLVLTELPATPEATGLQAGKGVLLVQPFYGTRAIRIRGSNGKLKDGQVLSGFDTENGWIYCPSAGVGRAPCFVDDDDDGALDRALGRPMTARNGFWSMAISSAGDLRGIYLANPTPLERKAKYEVLAPTLGLAGKYEIHWRLEPGSESAPATLVLWSKVGEFNSTTFNYGLGPAGVPGVSGGSVVRRIIGEGELRFPVSIHQSTEVNYHGTRLLVDPLSHGGPLTFRILSAPSRTVRFAIPGFAG